MTKILKLHFEKNSVDTFNSDYDETKGATVKLVTKYPQYQFFFNVN